MTNFGLRNGGREGGWRQSPPAIYIKGNSLSSKQLRLCMAEFVCIVSIFWIVLPQFVIAMTRIFYSETSIKRTPN